MNLVRNLGPLVSDRTRCSGIEPGYLLSPCRYCNVLHDTYGEEVMQHRTPIQVPGLLTLSPQLFGMPRYELSNTRAFRVRQSKDARPSPSLGVPGSSCDKVVTVV